MKVILLGDTHLGASSASPIIFSHQKKFFSCLFEYMEEHGITTIIQTGDLYDRRREVHFDTIHHSNEMFFDVIRDNAYTLYVVCGNHDSKYKNTNKINAPYLLRTLQMAVVYMAPETINIGGTDIDFYPWINDSNLAATNAFCEASQSKYAVGHFEFGGFPMYPGMPAEHGMSHSIFSRYDCVFSGHYHTISQKDNVLYVGTPYELTWSDYADPKGFWVFDTETGVKEFVSNQYTLFERIQYNDGMLYDVTNVTDKYVKLVVSEKTDQKAFDTFVSALKSAHPIDLKIIDKTLEIAVTDAVASTSETTDISTKTMIDSVLDKLNTNLDKTELKRRVSVVYNDALDLVNSL